jgi:hypothetical protein
MSTYLARREWNEPIPRLREATMTRPRFIPALVALYVTACGGEPQPLIPALDVELTEVASVGLLDGPDEFVFNRVGEVRGLPDGSFVVLDVLAPSVRWFGPEGEFRGEVSSVGQGPGEIQAPATLHVSPDGELAVWDRGTYRVNFFDLGPAGIDFRTYWAVEGHPYAEPDRTLCRADEAWWLAQPLLDASHAVRIFEGDPENARSLVDVRPPSREDLGGMTPIASAVMNAGMLLCAPDRARVVWAPLRWEDVLAFDPAGEPVWSGSYGDLQPEPYIVNQPATPGARPIFGFPIVSDGAHYLQSFVRWTDDSALLQYRFWSGQRRDPDVVRIESYEIAIDTGELLGRSEELPLIADVQGARVYLVENQPFARVIVMERR